MRLVFTTRANRDLVEILRWTGVQFGREQAGACLREIHRVLRFVAENPGLLRPANDIRPDLSKYVIASHVAYARITQDELRIVRILHGRMEPKRWL